VSSLSVGLSGASITRVYFGGITEAILGTHGLKKPCVRRGSRHTRKRGSFGKDIGLHIVTCRRRGLLPISQISLVFLVKFCCRLPVYCEKKQHSNVQTTQTMMVFPIRQLWWRHTDDYVTSGIPVIRGIRRCMLNRSDCYSCPVPTLEPWLETKMKPNRNAVTEILISYVESLARRLNWTA